MKIFCHTCQRSFAAGEDEIIYDNGSDMAVFKCPTCGIKYLAIADDKLDLPILLKLTSTKSRVIDEEKEEVKPKSSLILPNQARMIITPEEAAAEARRKR